MHVTFTSIWTCPVCGHQEHGFLFRSVRVNKQSLRSTGPGVGIAPPLLCQECQAPLADRPDNDRYRLDSDSTALVQAYRAKRGWL